MEDRPATDDQAARKVEGASFFGDESSMLANIERVRAALQESSNEEPLTAVKQVSVEAAVQKFLGGFSSLKSEISQLKQTILNE